MKTFFSEFTQNIDIYSKYKNLDIKMYPAGANAENFDPFIKVIEDTGREINLPEKSIFF